MGGSCSTVTIDHDTSSLNMGPAEEAERVSRSIDRQLKEDQRATHKHVKLLLLGAGESGKTTVLKQMKIIHLHGFSQEEMEGFKRQIFDNLCEAIYQCVRAMDAWEIPMARPENEAHLELFDYNWPALMDSVTYPPEYLPILKSLWADRGVQQAIARSNECGIPENMLYLFPELDRLFAPGYVPTHQDVLRARGKTTGITETAFISTERVYRLFDVGGQRSERKKWIHCFEGVTAVIFLAAMSGYDQCLLEDADSNIMQEALLLFDAIVNSKWFVRTHMILFLNKTDLFRDKLVRSAVRKYFPEYAGDPTDYQAVQTFFRDAFLALNRSKAKHVYVHFTCAIDTKALRVVMTSVTDIIVSTNLHTLLF